MQFVDKIDIYSCDKVVFGLKLFFFMAWIQW